MSGIKEPASTQHPLHVHTPLIESPVLSQVAGYNVYLKLDNAQPTNTFKIRGIGHMIQKAYAKGCQKLVCSSGGNAGLAAAYAARKLGLPLTLFVPKSTPEFFQERVKLEGAEVIQHGEIWDQANEKALQLAKEPGYTYVHPFDHPDVWEGHTSLMVEVAEDLRGQKPDLVIVSVGGGGLLCGVVQGMEKLGWHDVPILGMETVGADCFNAAVKAGKLVTLPDITSVAKCLGALTLVEKAWEWYQKRTIISEVVDDKTCVDACDRFLVDHLMLVEPACGASLAALYSGVVQKLQSEGKLGPVKNVVVIVCGGRATSPRQHELWKKQLGLLD